MIFIGISQLLSISLIYYYYFFFIKEYKSYYFLKVFYRINLLLIIEVLIWLYDKRRNVLRYYRI